MLPICFSAISVLSCVKSEKDTPLESTIDLMEIHAKLPDTDISLIQGWNFIAGNKDYTYSINSGKLIGKPKTSPYTMEKAGNNVEIGFYRRDFPPDDRNDLSDQSTRQKIVRTDALVARYNGEASKRIEVELKHLMMLIDFEVQGTSKDLEMSVIGAVVTKPYKISANRFQVINTVSGGLGIHLFLDTKRYDVFVKTDPFISDQHKKYILQYNSQYDTIAVINSPVTTWSSERWPE